MPSGYRSQRISILHPVSIGRELRVRQSQHAATALFAGAGVKGGHVFGVTDEKGERVTKSEWDEKRSIYPEDVVATIYSQLGIDWTKKLTNTPSGRAFEYIEPQSGTNFVGFREVSTLFA